MSSTTFKSFTPVAFFTLPEKSPKAVPAFTFTLAILAPSVTGVMDLREEEPEMEYRNSELVVTGLKVGTNVDIYDLSGKLVRHLESRRNGSYRLSLSDLSKGVYVVKVNQTTLKILKR